MITVKGYTKISKSVEGQAINELETNGYKVWTGLSRRKRPVWLGSIKTPEEVKKEKEFEDEVMRVTDTIWDYIGDRVDYVVLEKSIVKKLREFGRRIGIGKKIYVPASISKKAYYRFDPRGLAEPPGGSEHPDPKYIEVVRRMSGNEYEKEETKPKTEKREYNRGRSGTGRRSYRSARSSRGRKRSSSIRRIG
jgi:hypothetical protein